LSLLTIGVGGGFRVVAELFEVLENVAVIQYCTCQSGIVAVLLNDEKQKREFNYDGADYDYEFTIRSHCILHV
jgi:hypothetical protein